MGGGLDTLRHSYLLEDVMTYLPNYQGLHTDPITGRDIANPCWNGIHESDGLGREDECANANCQCGCHEPIDRTAK